MDPFHKLSPGKKAPEVVNVIIEIPRGSVNKYEIDEKTGLVWLDRVMHSPFHYPTDYGYVPQTLCEDGDPVDIMVSKPITTIKRNEIMAENSVNKIMQLFNGGDLECYLLMDEGHIRAIIDTGMLNNLVWSKLKLRFVKEKTNGFKTKILEYSN